MIDEYVSVLSRRCVFARNVRCLLDSSRCLFTVNRRDSRAGTFRVIYGKRAMSTQIYQSLVIDRRAASHGVAGILQ
ncbi:hypothetical protein ANTRET_LOCUS3136 [Anthophora retusa]